MVHDFITRLGSVRRVLDKIQDNIAINEPCVMSSNFKPGQSGQFVTRIEGELTSGLGIKTFGRDRVDFINEYNGWCILFGKSKIRTIVVIYNSN